jgi:hypothetical protein
VKAYEPKLDQGIASHLVPKNDRAAGRAHQEKIGCGCGANPKVQLEDNPADE